ncbi:MAG: TolC family protein [Bacteroidales bacterium]|nr:TolC family protein [Bacteroidales bacterium]
MFKIRTIIAILLTATGLALSAQTLSLDSCKALALQNNLTLKNAALDVAAAQEVKKQAFTKYFPNVSAIAGGYYAAKPLFEYSIDNIENASARQFLHNLYYEYGAAMGLPDRISLCENGLMAGATVVQPVYMGGQIVNGNKLAKVGIEAAELKEQLTEDQILQQVEEYYWLIISLEEKMKTLQQAKTFLDTLERDVTTAAEAGLVSKNDILKVKLKKKEIESNQVKVENGIRLSNQALCQLIGLEMQSILTLTDTLGDFSEMPYWEHVDNQSAVLGRKEKQLLDLQVDAEKLKKKMALGETLPHVTVGGTASYGNLIFDHFTANALAFATLQVPLTGWWEASHKLKQQDILIQKAENERADFTQKMYLETQQAWNNVDDAYNQYQLAGLALQDSEANLHNVKADYDAGLVPVSELLEAQTLLLQAQNQCTDALIDLKIKAERYKTITNKR